MAAAMSWANASPSWRSLIKAVFGSGTNDRSAAVASCRNIGLWLAKNEKFRVRHSPASLPSTLFVDHGIPFANPFYQPVVIIEPAIGR
jgi:hypothetical protein